MRWMPIALLGLRRLFRDKMGLFFVLLFPILITILVGFAIFKQANAGIRTGIVNDGTGALSEDLIETIEDSEAVVSLMYSSADALRVAVRRDNVDAGVIIPKAYDADLKSGRVAKLQFLTNPRSDSALAARSEISAALTAQATDARAAVFAVRNSSGTFEQNFAVARRLRSEDEARVGVETATVGKRETERQFSGFNYPSAANLILFVFITSLTASQQLIEARVQGHSRRMLASPTPSWMILLGQTAGRFLIALFQGLFIFAAGSILFGVEWGDPLGTALVIVLFSLVATGIAMLFGAMLKTPQQAGLGVPLGIGLGMLGGCMWPLEIVSPTMNTIGHFTPHAWAMDAFIDLIGKGATVADIALPLTMLAGFAAVFLGSAIVQFRRGLVG